MKITTAWLKCTHNLEIIVTISANLDGIYLSGFVYDVVDFFLALCITMKQNEARMSAKRLYKDISQSSNHTSEKQKNQEMLFRVAGWMCSCSWKMTSTY